LSYAGWVEKGLEVDKYKILLTSLTLSFEDERFPVCKGDLVQRA
jgi:hypothetical protein